MSLFATAFGSDGTAGDTSFYPQHFEASADDTFDMLMEKWRKVAAGEYFGEGSEPLTDEQIEEEEIEKPVGFWVYDEQAKNAVEAACGYNPGSDYALYAMVHSAKLILQKLGKEIRPSMQPVHLTLEPNKHNEDGCALTVYFPEGVSDDQVMTWAKETNPCVAGLGLDLEGDFLDVDQTECPFPGFVRFQLHPTC